MIFSASNDGIEWSLDFEPDSVTTTVKDLVQKWQQVPKKVPWQLGAVFSQRQNSLNNHLGRFRISPNQEGTMEMRHEVLSSVGAQAMDTSGYHVSHLEDIELHWDDPDLNMDSVFRPRIYTRFSPTTRDSLDMGGSVENPILFDDEKYQEKSPPTIPVSERSNRHPALLRSQAIGTKNENFPDYVYRNLFQ